MTYGKDYTLADKLQNQFKNRGADVSGMQASSTSELMRLAEMGKDPRVNCAEQAFRESYRTRGGAAQKREYTDRTAHTQQQTAQRRKQPSGTASSAASARPASGAKNTARRSGQARPNAKTRTSDTGRTAREEPREAFAEGAEVKVKQKGMSSQFIALLVIGTVMVMVLVLAISDAYRTTGEIAKLEAELETLQTEAADLRLQLEEKNDIRVIEEIATNDLGMVKEDALQRKYISLSDGEYIELLNTEEETEEQTGGVLLSSVFSSLGKFFERFK